MTESVAPDKPGDTSPPTSIKRALLFTASLKPPGCKHPHPVPTTDGELEYRRCGRATCCIGCRLKWAWKHTLMLIRSAHELPPNYFATIAPRGRITNVEFGRRSQKFLQALRRRVPDLEHLRVSEWRNGKRHDHALLRAARILRRWVKAAKRVAKVRCSVGRVGSVVACCRYIVKHTRRPERIPELPPADHKGPIVSPSRGFLVLPLKPLWRLVCRERAAKKGSG